MIWYAPNAVKPHNMHNNHASRIRFLKKVETFYISHGSVVTFLRVNGGQVHENQCQMPSGLCLESIIKITFIFD